MRLKAAIAVSAIVGLLVPSLAPAQHPRTFRATTPGAAVLDAYGNVHGA